MPTVRYTADGGRYRTGGVTFEPGDAHEVPAGLAEHLVADVGDFEYVDEPGDVETLPEPDDLTVDDEPDTEEDEDLVNELQEMTIPEFEEDLESGRFDDRLEAVADAERKSEDRAGIHDAIGVRRAELEG